MLGCQIILRSTEGLQGERKPKPQRVVSILGDVGCTKSIIGLKMRGDTGTTPHDGACDVDDTMKYSCTETSSPELSQVKPWTPGLCVALDMATSKN